MAVEKMSCSVAVRPGWLSRSVEQAPSASMRKTVAAARVTRIGRDSEGGGMRATLIDGLLSCQGRLRRSRERHIHAMNPPTAPGKGRRGAIVSWNGRSEEHTSELQSLMRISYAVV